jgi:hypothetical protein
MDELDAVRHKWIKDVERLYKAETGRELVVTTSTYYNALGFSAEDYVKGLLHKRKLKGEYNSLITENFI